MLSFFSNTKLSAAMRRAAAVLFGEDVACGTLRVAVFVGIVKESQLVLGFEDAAAGRVEGLHAYLARHDGLF